jgi:transcriptional regulator with XRE-family HTH domain
MSDHESTLRTVPWMLRDPAEPLSDSLIEAFLNGVVEPDEARTMRIRRAFVHRLLSQLHPVPVRHVEDRWSFGRWIEAIRQSVGLTRADIAAAISDDAGFVERVERTDVPPWLLETRPLADLICLFRVHISAVEVLFVRSGAVVRGHETTAAAARSAISDLNNRGESARKALDLYLAARAPQAALAALPQGVMEGVRRELEERRAFDLLGVSK